MLSNNKTEMNHIVSGLLSVISVDTCTYVSPIANKMYINTSLIIQYAADPHDIIINIVLFLYNTLLKFYHRKSC